MATCALPITGVSGEALLAVAGGLLLVGIVLLVINTVRKTGSHRPAWFLVGASLVAIAMVGGMVGVVSDPAAAAVSCLPGGGTHGAGTTTKAKTAVLTPEVTSSVVSFPSNLVTTDTITVDLKESGGAAASKPLAVTVAWPSWVDGQPVVVTPGAGWTLLSNTTDTALLEYGGTVPAFGTSSAVTLGIATDLATGGPRTGSVTATIAKGKSTTVAVAMTACSYVASSNDELQGDFTKATEGTVVCLGGDVAPVDPTTDNSVLVPVGINMTLDLNGHNLTLYGDTSDQGHGALGILATSGLTITNSGGESSSTLTATSDGAAGIGGGVNAGPITGSDAGKITFDKVTVVATGNDGAGIGAGFGATVGAVTITDSKITANSDGSTDGASGSAAAIGSGFQAPGTDGPFIIDNSNVTATAGSGGAGIGSGGYSTAGDITITDSTVTASAAGGAAIGSGLEGDSNSIEISNSTVTAKARDFSFLFGEDWPIQSGAGIGAGQEGSSGPVTIENGSTVTAHGNGGSGIGSGIEGKTCGAIAIHDSKVDASAFNGSAIGASFANPAQVSGSITIDHGSTVTATAAKSTDVITDGDWAGQVYFGGSGIGNTGDSYNGTASPADGAITIDHATLKSVTGDAGVGIGGAGSPITITDSTLGTITAGNGSGIGSQYDSPSGDITLTGDTFTGDVTSTQDGPGIGEAPGLGGNPIAITISGTSFAGTITGSDGAGVGSGYGTPAGPILIEGHSSFTANGNDGAGIGSGGNATADTITITDSTVTAGGQDGAGIGSGFDADAGAITITSSTVTATSSDDGAGIGSGYGGNVDVITITSSTVNATSTNDGAGLGSGYGGNTAGIFLNSGTITAAASPSDVPIGSDNGADGGITYGAGVTVNGVTY